MTKLMTSLAIALLLTGCGGEDELSGTNESTTTTAPEPTTTTVADTTVVETTTTTAPPTTASPTATAEVQPAVEESTGEETALPSAVEATFRPAWDSIELLLLSWEGSASTNAGAGNDVLALTVTIDDVVHDDSRLLIADALTGSSFFGAAADGTTGQVIGTLGLTDPDSGELSEMLSTQWTAAFGLLETPSLAELFDPVLVLDMVPGDQMRATKSGKNILLQFTEGANANDGLFLLSIVDETLFANDPGHRTLIEPILAQVTGG